MCYDYSKLLGRIKEMGYTQESLARGLSKSKTTVNQKLRGNAVFTQQEIAAICDCLAIPPTEIPAYFLRIRFRKNKPSEVYVKQLIPMDEYEVFTDESDI